MTSTQDSPNSPLDLGLPAAYFLTEFTLLLFKTHSELIIEMRQDTKNIKIEASVLLSEIFTDEYIEDIYDRHPMRDSNYQDLQYFPTEKKLVSMLNNLKHFAELLSKYEKEKINEQLKSYIDLFMEA